MVFTGSGDKAFCTGGNTKEYAEYYAGNPQEYRRYMRLFNDMVTSILGCDKPVINRVNGMRVGGGQEIGMACDFSIAQDWRASARPGPSTAPRRTAGPPISSPSCRRRPRAGGVRAVQALVGARRLHGPDHKVVPALKLDGSSSPSRSWRRDVRGRVGTPGFGKPKTGAAMKEARR